MLIEKDEDEQQIIVKSGFKTTILPPTHFQFYPIQYVMRKSIFKGILNVLFLSLPLMHSTPCHAQYWKTLRPGALPWAQEDFKGKLKFASFKEYSVNDKRKKLEVNTTYQFDEGGKPIEKIVLKNGSLVSKAIYKYDIHGNIIENEESKFLFKYDGNGNVIEELEYPSADSTNGVFVVRRTYKSDSIGNTTEMNEFRNGHLAMKIACEYDKQGRKIKLTYVDGDKSNPLISHLNISSNGATRDTTVRIYAGENPWNETFKYDLNGKMVEYTNGSEIRTIDLAGKKAYQSYKSDDKKAGEVYIYKCDKNGFVLGSPLNDQGHRFNRWIATRDVHGNILHREFFDFKSGVLNRMDEWQYQYGEK